MTEYVRITKYWDRKEVGIVCEITRYPNLSHGGKNYIVTTIDPNPAKVIDGVIFDDNGSRRVPHYATRSLSVISSEISPATKQEYDDYRSQAVKAAISAEKQRDAELAYLNAISGKLELMVHDQPQEES